MPLPLVGSRRGLSSAIMVLIIAMLIYLVLRSCSV